MKKEWNTPFLRDIERLKETTLKHSNKTREFFPQYILKREFFDDYLESLGKSFTDISINPYLKFSNYQEFRILTLLNNLNKAKLKFFLNTKERRDPISEEDYALGMDLERSDILPLENRNTSQLVLVNNIIKNSFELTSYVLLLEWLQSIYTKEEPSRSVVKDRVYFEKTSEKLSKGGSNAKFHPDLLNYKNNVVDSDEMDKFCKLIEMTVILIRQGKVEEAQKLAEYYNQSFISAMLNGGLPMNDFILDKAETLSKIDFELFPPYMKTKDLADVKNNILNLHSQRGHMDGNIKHVQSVFDKVVGNPNWLLWLHSIYDACEFKNDDKIMGQMKLLQTYLSGNPSFIDKNNFSIYDSLYTSILSMLNFKIIGEYTKDGNLLNVHFTEDQPDFSGYYNKVAKGKDINDMINIIRTKDKYKEAVKTDFLIDFELQLVQLHFIEFNQNNSQEYYERLNNFLFKIIETISDQSFDGYLRTHYNFIDNNIQNRSEIKMSQNEIKERDDNNINLIKLNYLKLIFNTLITFYASNSSIFGGGDSGNYASQTIEQIYKNFDILIHLYFDKLTNFIQKMNYKFIPDQLVYILGFCLDIQTVQENLTDLANRLKDFGSDNFKALVRQIDQHFANYQEDLNSNIANNTHIFKIPYNNLSIDQILENELKLAKPCVIAPEDEIKINQINLLFTEGKLDTIVVLKFMLKLSLKFLSSNKFSEALELDNTFRNQLNINNILGLNFVKKYNLEDDLNFLFLLEKNSSSNLSQRQEKSQLSQILEENGLELFNIGIYFTVLFSKLVLNCYFNYSNLAKNILQITQNNNTLTYNMLVNKCKEVVKTFTNFIRLMRVFVGSEEIKEVLVNFFGEDIYLQDIQNIISKWIYQVLKWSVDLYTQNTFRKENLMADDGLKLLIDLLNVQDDTHLKNYLVDNNPQYLETEKTFFRFLDMSHERRKDIFCFIYQLSSINRNILNEVFDDNMNAQLVNEIENYEF